MSLARGVRLGPYEIFSPLGAGGMGEVYRARDSRLDREVAVKVLPERVAGDAEALARFEREAKAVAALSHPNILAIHDFGTHEGIAYAVMELLDGETLRSRLDAGPLPLKETLDYSLQIARGLGAAHQRSVVHRDIKPENLFITKDRQVKILDFGLAKRSAAVAPGEETSAPTVSGYTLPGTVMGTLGYMSPEQVQGLAADHRSDLFSFGAVLYEMASGERPFKGNSAMAVADAILHAEPREFGRRPLPGKLKSLIRRLLAKDPAKRYASAEEVQSELKALNASLAPRRVSRNAWIAVAAAVLVVAAAVGGIWRRSSRERWALQTAAPEVARLVTAEQFSEAAALARQARAILPTDPTLEKLWTKATGEATVESDPPGAAVAIRPLVPAADAWQTVGTTPLRKVRVPNGPFLWRVAKNGFAPIEFLDETPVEWKLKLKPEKSVPSEMVIVPSIKTSLGAPFASAPRVQLDDYLIDRHEVTNEDYKRFVDAGGYGKPIFWKQPFTMDGRTIPWEAAMAHFRDTTGQPGPATWEVGSFPKGQARYPVSGVSWFEAAAYAEFAGKGLPTIYHWTAASQAYFVALIVQGSNFRGAMTRPVDGGALGGFGTTDMAGNVKEWCWNESWGGKRFILGGGFGEANKMFTLTDAQSPWDRRPNYGFRCMKLSSPAPAATTVRLERSIRDAFREKPVSDEVFKAFKSLYAYDKEDLGAKVEEKETGSDWMREKVSFNAAYGGERIPAHLFLPRNASPPFQTVIYFPGSNALELQKFDPAFIEDEMDFIPKSGRALFFPIYKGTFERKGKLKPGGPEGDQGALWRDHLFMWSKDLGRSLDYLSTRSDIDMTKTAYVGYSLGSTISPVLLAVEDRVKTAILLGGGLYMRPAFPEVEPINFLPRVKIPVLMLNGQYDDRFPVDFSQVPFFRFLGTPEKDKRHILNESGHATTSKDWREEVRESLDWLAKYLGPVKR